MFLACCLLPGTRLSLPWGKGLHTRVRCTRSPAPSAPLSPSRSGRLTVDDGTLYADLEPTLVILKYNLCNNTNGVSCLHLSTTFGLQKRGIVRSPRQWSYVMTQNFTYQSRGLLSALYYHTMYILPRIWSEFDQHNPAISILGDKKGFQQRTKNLLH
jgi:hypothetical protein